MWFKSFPSIFLGLGLAIAALVACDSIDEATHAPVVTANTMDVLYEATLPHRDNSTVRGWISVCSSSTGIGIMIHADFWGLPDDETLTYHIHEYPVPEDGNCYSTGAHLDPYNRGDETPCDITAPHTCQVGDLAGKHGPIFTSYGQPFEIQYSDLFLSTEPETPAFLGNRSLVVHRVSDNARLNCGNFEMPSRYDGRGIMPMRS